MRLRLVIAALLLCAGSAWAQTMTGRYQGIGIAEGLVLELRQADAVIQGKVTGAAQWALNGQTDGAGSLTGTIFKGAQGQVPFQGYWTAGGVRIETFNPGGPSAAYDFVPVGQAFAQPQVVYYLGENGHPAGPFTLDEALARIGAGGQGPQQPVWRSDMPAWATTGELPELQAALAAPAVVYYVEENGAGVGPLTLDDVLARVRGGALARTQGIWRSDTSAWAPADSFPELLAAFPPPQGAPQGVEYYIDDNGTTTGPLTLDQVRARAAEGSLLAGQGVWKSDTRNWAQATALPELAGAFPQPTAEASGIQFYIEENGQPVGPLSIAEMHARIRAGSIRPFDGVWNTLTQSVDTAEFYPELRDAFPPDDITRVSSEYYIDDGTQSLGPFTFQEMIDRIRVGEIAADQMVTTADDRGRTMASLLVEFIGALMAAPTPSAVEQQRTIEYYFEENGNAVGPFGFGDMSDFILEGTVGRDTQIWDSTSQLWQAAGALAEFLADFDDAEAAMRAAAPTQAQPDTRPAPQGDEEALRETVAAIALADNPTGSAEDLDVAEGCLLEALGSLTPEERQGFPSSVRVGTAEAEGGVDRTFPGMMSTIERLEAAHPGIGQAIEACI